MVRWWQMRKPKLGSVKHRKLFIAFTLLVLVVAGFFVYKYTYIYLERKKFDKATNDINLVMQTLENEQILTKKFEDCGRNQEVYGFGSVTCSTGFSIKYLDKVAPVLKLVNDKLISQNFIYKSGTVDFMNETVTNGASTYSHSTSGLNCYLMITSEPQNHTVDFYCTKSVKYKVF